MSETTSTPLIIDAATLARRLQPVLLAERLAAWRRVEHPIVLDVRDGRLLVVASEARLSTHIPLLGATDSVPRTVLASPRELDSLLELLPEGGTRAGQRVELRTGDLAWQWAPTSDAAAPQSAYAALYAHLTGPHAPDPATWPAVAVWAIAAHAAGRDLDDLAPIRGWLQGAADQLNNRAWDVFRPEMRRHVTAAGQVWAALDVDRQQALGAQALSVLEGNPPFTTRDFDELSVLLLFERRHQGEKDIPEPARSRVAVTAALTLGIPSHEGPTLLPSEHRRLNAVLTSPALAAVAQATGALPTTAAMWAPAFDAGIRDQLAQIARREVREFSAGYSDRLTSMATPALILATRRAGDPTPLSAEQRKVLSPDDEAIVDAHWNDASWPKNCAPLGDEERQAVARVLANRIAAAARAELTEARAAGQERRVGGARESRQTEPLTFLADGTGTPPALGAGVHPDTVTTPITVVHDWSVPAWAERRAPVVELTNEDRDRLLPPPILCIAAIESGVPLVLRPASGEALVHTPALTTVASAPTSTPAKAIARITTARDGEVFAVAPEAALVMSVSGRDGRARVAELPAHNADEGSEWEISTGDMTWVIGDRERQAADILRSHAWCADLIARIAAYERGTKSEAILNVSADATALAEQLVRVRADRVPLESEHVEAGIMPVAELSTISIGQGNYIGMGRETARDRDPVVLSTSPARRADAEARDVSMRVQPDAVANAIGLAVVSGTDGGTARVRATEAKAGEKSGDLEVTFTHDTRPVSILVASPDRAPDGPVPLTASMRAVVGLAGVGT